MNGIATYPCENLLEKGVYGITLQEQLENKASHSYHNSFNAEIIVCALFT